MIKKTILLLATALVAGGMVWARPGDPPIPTPTPPPGLPGAPSSWSGRDAVGNFQATPLLGLSTESRNSASLFRGHADDFIDPRFHDTEIDNFLFVSVASPGRVDLGFARNLGLLYLAVYYGGGIGELSGQRVRENETTNMPYRSFTWAEWDNNLALLVGIAGMGIRLDATFNSNVGNSVIDHSNLSDGEESRILTERYMGNFGPSVALTWGATFGPLAPWASIGYRFAGSYRLRHEASDFAYEDSLVSGAALAATAGARFDLSDVMAVGAALNFRSTFPQRELYTGTEPPDRVNDDGSLERDFSNRRHGMTGFGIDLYYLQKVRINEALELRFRPRLYGGLSTRSNDWYGGTIDWAAPWDRWTTVAGAIHLGASFRPNDLLGFFGGVDLGLLDWSTWSQIGGDDMYPAIESSWRVRGVRNTGMGLGMTLSPAENVTFGVGLNGLFSNNYTIDLTASVRFGGGGTE